jgi:heat shock protein 1/8
MAANESYSAWDLNVDYAIGIDLGTTYSCVAVYQNNRIVVVTDENGHKLIPSAVALVPTREGIKEHVGYEALENAEEPKFLITGKNIL